MSVLSQFGPPVPYAATAGSVTNGVYTIGNQTIGGTKTFTSTIVGDISGNAGTATTANFATSAGSVTDGVYTVGNQTIGGIKTFTSTIVGDISGNAGTVTNGVYTTGNQTIGGTKTFSSTIVGDISGNAGTVTNGVYTSGNQTIAGTKTFSSTIVGDVSGNAGTVTNGVYTSGNQTIGGTKTFSTNPILSAGTANTILVLDGSKQIAAASGLGYNTTTRTLTLGVGDTPDFRIGRGAGNLANNTAVGANSLVANTTGTGNTAFGDGALFNNTDQGNNTGIGFNALYNGGGNNLGTNTAVGANSLRSLTTGYDNTAVGTDSLRATTTGRWNVAIGERALRNNTTGFWNIAVGADTLLNTSTGPANIAIGRSALSDNTTGSSNVAVGHNALIGNTTGTGNTSVGTYTQTITRTGSRNITIGYASGELITTGSNNSILGSFDGNLHGIDIRTASNNIVLSDGAGVPRAYYNATASTWDFRTGASPGTVRLTIGDSAVTVANVLSLAAGTALLPSLAATGDLDTGMWFPSANTVAWSTGGLEAMRINPNRRVGIGGSGNDFHRLTVVENSNNSASILCHTTSDTVAPGVTQLRVRTSGSVQNGDGLGATVFQGYDGVSGFASASMFGEVDGAASAGSVPTRLRFLTTPSGSVTQQERMRINAAGEVGIGKTAASGVTLDVNGIIHAGERLQLTNGFANMSMLQSSTGVGYRWALANNGTYRLQRTANGTYSDATTPIIFDASNNVGIGTTAPGGPFSVQRSDSSTTIGGSVSVIKLNNGSGTLNSTSGLEFFHTNDLTVNTGRLAGVYGLYESFNGSGLGGALVFATNTAGDATIDERMRIKSAGQVRFVPLAADPTVNVEDGDVYYNSGTNKLRLRAAGAWVDLN